MRRDRWRWLAFPIALLLAGFNLRRLIFTVAAFWKRRGFLHSQFSIQPSVLILVPCRDEAAMLPGLIAALNRLDYPAGRLRVALIDDGSRDKTRRLIALAAENHSGWWAIHHAASRGKAHALNDALAQIGFGDIVVVYDADHRPAPDSLKQLLAAFDDPGVAGASGRTIPLNPTASLPAYYATVESLVHQLITMQAKDRLDLAPALLGSNCAYRRDALEQAGGFRPGVLLEDSDLTLAFARQGYRLRFVPESIAWHQVPETAGGYVRQHLRWARGFNDVARDHTRGVLADRRLPLHLRFELTLFALGYLDRLALLAALGVTMSRRVLWPDQRRKTKDEFLDWMLRFALLMPLVQIVAALSRARASRAMWVRLPAIPLLFSLDVWVAARAAIESLLNRPRAWTKTERQRIDSE
ncbi:MAG TPA: glycosyltransferase [Anaerolineae bacterium]|nr:glycosyltransferase [Anaerolineae bacterium]